MSVIIMDKQKADNCEIDPDYATHNIALKRAVRIKEENDDSVDTLKRIIQEEFNNELFNRQTQIEEIEKRIHKTQKLLHVIRYVLISSYYDNKELEYNGIDETNVDTASLFDQNRMHPALKKLLGKNPKFDFSGGRSKRKVATHQKPNVLVQEMSDSSLQEEPLKSFDEPNPQITNQNMNTVDYTQIDRNRHKIKNRIIVGNISKWLPSYEDDSLTHKWMMYVRGPKESPEVSHFIQKVSFYLHPSYKPHDVVDVCETPFHLSRRGWGEFPIRVQIHFKCFLNKPVDIIHNLKLDKTYSGRQTLGNESVIDLYLYEDTENNITQGSIKRIPKKEEIDFVEVEDNEMNIKSNTHKIVDYSDICESSILTDTREVLEDWKNRKWEDVKPVFVVSEASTSSFEHDYCSGNTVTIKMDPATSNEILNSEHSYSCPSTYEFLNLKSIPESTNYADQSDNLLIYGLDESYSQPDEDLSKKEPLFYRKTLVYTAKQPVTNIQRNGKIAIMKRKPNESLWKKMFTNKLATQLSTKSNVDDITFDMSEQPDLAEPINYGEYKIIIPKNCFKCVAEALPYLFNRLPLISHLANEPNYKCLYPFTAKSTNEYYSSWNNIKRSSTEWSRAKTIKNIMKQEAIHDCDNWNTKAILMYGRSHGYTPLANYSLISKESPEKDTLSSCFNVRGSLKRSVLLNYEPSVDVEHDETKMEPSPKKRKLSQLDISDSVFEPHCSYIRQEALDCGIVFKNEQFDEDITFNGAERMILEAVKCLGNQLVRRSLFFGISNGDYSEIGGKINDNHVKQAIEERQDLQALKEFKNKQNNMKYFFQ